MMWRCLVEENIRAGQVSNVGCGSEHRPVVANNHKLEEKYRREYNGMVREWWSLFCSKDIWHIYGA